MVNTIQARLAGLEKPIKVGIAGAGEFSLEMITPFFSMSDEEIIALHDKVINKTQIILYHGSEPIVNPPVFGKGESANDYGLGFI